MFYKVYSQYLRMVTLKMRDVFYTQIILIHYKIFFNITVKKHTRTITQFKLCGKLTYKSKNYYYEKRSDYSERLLSTVVLFGNRRRHNSKTLLSGREKNDNDCTKKSSIVPPAHKMSLSNSSELAEI